MKKIATKVIKKIKANGKEKIINLSEYRTIKQEVQKEHSNLFPLTKKLKQGYDPQHTIYIAAQNMLSFMIEAMSGLPEFHKLNTIIERAQEMYMPSWPPMSPISLSCFVCWTSFDIKIGIDKENYTSCVIEVNKILSDDFYFNYLYDLMQQSRLGLYRVVDYIDDKIILEELFTKKRYKCYSPNRTHPFMYNELWLTRLFPPVDKQFDYYIVFTSPYVLVSSQQDWQDFLDRNIKGVRDTKVAEQNYDLFMRQGLGNNYYWLEFIMQGYSEHSDVVIYLTGIPDRGNSRPHFSKTSILPEAIL
jgi:hypothetical protein